MEQNIADKLILGSKNIDLMRERTVFLIRVISSRLAELLSGAKENKIREDIFESDKCKWQVKIEWDSKDVADVVILCFVMNGTGWLFAFSNESKEKFSLNLQTVQKAYENLPLLLNGLLKTFPLLTDMLKPLLDASEVKM